MLIHLMREARGADASAVDTYLRADRADRTPDMVADIRRLMDDYGSIDFAELHAEGIASAADEAFDDAFAGAHGPRRQYAPRDGRIHRHSGASHVGRADRQR
jgi:hypothetical protein